MRVPGAKAIRRIGWRLRGRLLGGGVILGYHRVADDPRGSPDPMIHPDRFREQMSELRRDFRPTPLSGIAEASRGRAREGLPVAVTFDDGYLDVLENALPVAEELGIPVTIFVVTGALGQSHGWDRSENANRSGKGDPGEPAPPVVGSEHLRGLAHEPLVEVGSHTVSHRALPELPPAEATRELLGSRRTLEDLLGRPVTRFSDPHGLVTRGLPALVEEAGYARACASGGGLVSAGSDPFLLPRVWPGDLPGPAFRKWLRSWTGRGARLPASRW